MYSKYNSSRSLAAAITKSSSKQTYYTIRFFVDRERVDDAYRAYAYFRWVDDVLDTGAGEHTKKSAFINRQKSLLAACYRGETPTCLCAEEQMLADLVQGDTEKNSGLQAYLHNMMAVMVFDAERRDRTISQTELSEYSQMLATAVTEAIYHFIGHENPAHHHEARYQAVTAAHIVHMLRDTFEDVEAGYFNIPNEYLQTHGVSPRDLNSNAYRKWVCERVQMARQYFKEGQECTAQVKNLRCRLAGYAYTARFEWMLRIIERDNYCLRDEYPERKSLSAASWMVWKTLTSLLAFPKLIIDACFPATKPVRVKNYEN